MIQITLLKRFQEIAERIREFGSLKGLFIGIGREVDNGHINLLMDEFSGFNSVNIAVNHDVHENQVDGLISYK